MTTESGASDALETSAGLRVAAALGVVVVLVAGIFVLGRLAPSTLVAMGLTSVWFLVVAVGAFVLVRRRRGLLVPLAAGYLVVALISGVVLGLPLITERTVDEDVTVAAPVATSGSTASSTAAPAPTGPVALRSGQFQKLEHPGRGTATLIRLPDGNHRVTFTDFVTDNGPDLRVYLSDALPDQHDPGAFIDLGVLKGNRGNQQYDLPAGTDPAKYRSVVVWCRAFSAGFTGAPLS